MAYEQRDNSGSIFRNEKKTTDKHPNGTGKAMIGGVMYYVSAWTKEGTKGPFQSLSFTPVESAQQPATSSQQQAAPSAYDDSDIPF